jgi:hypothetical protein
MGILLPDIFEVGGTEISENSQFFLSRGSDFVFP